MSTISDHGQKQPLVSLDVEQAVHTRYSAASRERQSALCCPIQYDERFLEVLPPELIERDYGCGDPSRYVREGETVVDLGSGGGKICYIASQIVGPQGRVIGVDMNDEITTVMRLIGKEVQYQANFEMLLDRDLPEVLASAHGIAQIITNLVVNALHAVEEIIQRPPP